MKKRVLALVCAMVMTMAMGMTVCAANSPTASVTSKDVVSSDTKVETPSQSIDYDDVRDMVAATTVSSSVECTFNNVSVATVAEAVEYAQATLSKNAFIATIFDLKVPSGKAASFTVKCPNVYAGQKVVVLHRTKTGDWETITPSNVSNGSVTFSMSSYSPVAIVVDGTASKTADVVSVAAMMALVGLAGATVCGKKRA